ncbi:MAG: DUF3419 family protein [Bacteroidota bacterium]
MSYLFDFGISQEDPRTEQFVMNLQASDHVLSVVSGGEVPLALISMNNEIKLTAADISEPQVKLCRLKLLAAVYLEFPINGKFLGYSEFEGTCRKKIYYETIRPHLPAGDASFWDHNMAFIEKGIINAGRFEQYIKKIRFVAHLFIGKKNIQRLISCRSIGEQSKVFHDHIASRKSLQLLFKIAFHPAIYRKRGLQEQALMHAGKSTGEKFYSRFRDFCISGLASENYFLQYFLTGTCISGIAFPEFLQPANKQRLIHNMKGFELVSTSLQAALSENEKGFFNKIHLSNLGDWLSEDEFNQLRTLINKTCKPGTRICYRYLQKNHFPEGGIPDFGIDKELSAQAQSRDRFPFYTILALTMGELVRVDF